MEASLPAVITFALSVIFSPGPNNIMSASIGMMHGYRKAVRFTLGVACGFAIIMLLGALAATLLVAVLPSVQPLMKYVGATYILWLAWATWSNRQEFGQRGDGELSRSQGYGAGFALQFANPKGMTFSLVLFTTFLSGLTDSVLRVAVSAVILAGVAFVATSTWALAGTGIRKWLNSDSQRNTAAGVLVAALVYTAIDMAGLLGLVAG